MDLTLTAEEIERFLSKYEPTPSGCRVWTGEKNSNGYGRFPIYRQGRRVRLLSHRVAFALKNELRDDQVLRHSCDNPPCGAPEHLRPGTQADNMRDALERGRVSTQGLTAYREGVAAAARQRLVTGRKTCRACGVEKPLSGFSIHRANCDGRQYECKACQSARRNRPGAGGLSERERRKLKRRAA